MPLSIRRLPGTQKFLIDPKSIPDDRVVINPSIAGDIVYMRCIQQIASQHLNKIVLFNVKTSITTDVPVPWSLLQPTIGYYTGLEDLRIVWHRDKLYFTATSTHVSISQQSEMVVGYFSSDLKSVERMSYIDLGPPPVKNVCPFVVDGHLMLLDTFNMAIYTVDTDKDSCNENEWIGFPVTLTTRLTGNCSSNIFLQNKDTKGTLRGSTSPVHLHGNLWGCLVHDVIYHDIIGNQSKAKLAYLHQWIEFDVTSGKITFTSTPFFLVKFGIEFVSGIELQDNEKVVLYMGVDDKIPIVIETNLCDLRA